MRHLAALAFLLAFLATSPSWAAPAFVQGCESAGTVATTQACTFGTSTTAGNAILCGTGLDITAVAALLSAADTSGSNTYTLLTQTANSNNVGIRQFYALNITGGWTVVTATYQNSSANKAVHCAEFSGLQAFDQQAGNAQTDPGTGTDAVTSGNITTTQADEVLFTTSCCSPTTIIVGTNYTYIDAGPSFDQGSAYRIVSSTGTYAGTWTANNAADDFATRIASFSALASSCRGALMMMGAGGC